MKTLLALLLAFLCLGVEGGEGGEPVDAADGGEGGGDDLDTLEDLADLDPAESDEPREAPAAGRRSAAQLEADLQAEREARIRAEARAAPQQAPQQMRDPDFDREEEDIRSYRASGASADQIALREWQINSNRLLRNNNRNTLILAAQTQDAQDKMQFDRIEQQHPDLYKRYAARVEDVLMQTRRGGQNAPRAAILRVLVGDDLISGKLKRKGSPAKREEPRPGAADRGRTVSGRSDVAAKGKATEREKREQRLLNVRI